MDVIYLDNNATTRAAEEVVTAMQPFWRHQYGNPSSLHREGQAARHAIENARQQVADLIGAKPCEIIFTSGGTESANLAILGTLAAHPTKRHIVTTAVEHVAVQRLCERLVQQGFRVTFVGVDSQEHLDLAEFEQALGDDTAIANVMYANNETGVVFPIEQVSQLAAARGVPLHVDAVQAAGKLAVDVKRLGVGLLSLSSHKMHGPKGVGALCVGPRNRLRSQLVGGSQERGIRPGTENVAAIVGFGKAAELAATRLPKYAAEVATLRDRLEAQLLQNVDFAHVIGDQSMRIANTTCIGFERLSAEAVLIALSEKGVCASSGSACSSGAMEPSHVLAAMNVDERVAHGAVRFSLSRETTEAQVDRAVAIVTDVVRRLASLDVT